MDKEDEANKYNTKGTGTQRERILEMKFGPSKREFEQDNLSKEVKSRREFENQQRGFLDEYMRQYVKELMNKHQEQTNMQQ